jgi:hypothetical protein
MSNKHVDEAIRSMTAAQRVGRSNDIKSRLDDSYGEGAIRAAIEVADEELNEKRGIRHHLERHDYKAGNASTAELLQMVRHFVGLPPDPQLTESEKLNEPERNTNKAA